MKINDNTQGNNVIGFLNPKYPEGVTWDSEEAKAFDEQFLEVLQTTTVEVDVVKSPETGKLTYLLKAV